MNNIMTFEGNQVEIFELNNEVLFNPYDVGRCLDLTDTAVRMAISQMSQKQVVKLKNSDVKSIDIRKLNNAGENFLTEKGVYKLIFKSRKSNAEKFQDWVTDEVLPSIRKHGGYLTPQKIEEVLLNPDTIIELATQLKLEREKSLALSQKIELDQPKVEWAEQCLESITTLKIGDYAKLIHRENDIEIGQNRLFNFLRSRNILNENNMPYQEYMDRGWFEVIERPVQTVNGTIIKYTPKITPKGQQGLLTVIKKYYNK